MSKTQRNEPGGTDLALGLKTATFVVVLGLIAAFADHAVVTPSEGPVAALAAPQPPKPESTVARTEVPFTVNAGDVEPQPPTF